MNYLKSVYRKRVNLLLSSLEKARGKSDLELIHRLRVGIKKMRAIIHFLNISGITDSKKEIITLLKPIFSHAGFIREVQVNRVTLGCYTLPPASTSAYLSFLMLEEQKAIAAFQQDLVYARQTSLRKKLIRLEEKMTHYKRKKIISHAELFIQNRFRKIRSILNRPRKLADLHQVRKYLKGLEPVLGITERLSGDKRFTKMQDRIKRTNRLLGHWHDLVVLQMSLDQFLKAHPAQVQKKSLPLYLFASRLRKETETMQLELIPQLQKLFKPV